MTTNVPPSRTPANDDSMTGMFRLVLKKMLQNVDDMLPAIVLEHDRGNNRVKVRPLIAKVDTEDRVVQRNDIASVPVINLGGGGFFVNFNLPAGSLGWIKANDRDISLFLQSYSEQAPNTERMHNFSDSLFIPDTMTGYTIASEDDEAMVIQNLDGSVKISLNANRIKLTAPRFESVTTGDFVINADNMMITLQSDYSLNAVNQTNTLTGDYTMTNSSTSITSSGMITANSVTIDPSGAIVTPTTVSASGVSAPSVSAGGKEMAGHTHPAGSPPGNTGPNN